MWNFDFQWYLAFDLAFMTFTGLFQFFWDPWCLRSPVICSSHISEHYFMENSFQLRFPISDHCDSWNLFRSKFIIRTTGLKTPNPELYLLQLPRKSQAALSKCLSVFQDKTTLNIDWSVIDWFYVKWRKRERCLLPIFWQ